MTKRPAAVRSLTTVLVVTGLFYWALRGSSPAAAQRPAGAATSKTTAAPKPQSRPLSSPSQPSLAQFSWLAGYWHGEWGPRVAQQIWMAPRSGAMVGAFQLSEDGKTLVIELFTITSTPNGLELRVRRFTPSLTPWPGPAVLRLKSADSKSIVFENADNGQPKSWLMKRTDADTFVQTFEITSQKGTQRIAEITYHRASATAPGK